MGTKSGTNRSQQGFTLLELLFAGAILSVVAMGVGATVAQTPRILRSVRDGYAARAALQSIAAQVNAAPFSVVAAQYAGRGFAVAGLHAAPGDADKLPGFCQFEYGDEFNQTFYRVTISVTWWDGRTTRTERSTLWLSNVRGDPAPPAPLPKNVTGEQLS